MVGLKYKIIVTFKFVNNLSDHETFYFEVYYVIRLVGMVGWIWWVGCGVFVAV